MFRPMRSVMHERENYISNIEKDIVDAENQFDSLIIQIKEQEAAVRNEAFEQKEKLEAAGSRQAEEILASVRKEIAALKDKTQKDIDVQIKAARKHVKKESEALSRNFMEAVLHRSLKS
jgi:F0F1-type ATP synthase membrane subunit b/b'